MLRHIRASYVPALLLIALFTSGCGLRDITLWLGNWRSFSKAPSNSFDFKFARFETRTEFSSGWFSVEGRYKLHKFQFPRQMELQVNRITYLFHEEGIIHTAPKRLSSEEAKEIIDRFWRQVRGPGDIEAAQRLSVFVQAKVSDTPIYCIYNKLLVILHLAFNMPYESPPGLFDTARFREYYHP